MIYEPTVHPGRQSNEDSGMTGSLCLIPNFTTMKPLEKVDAGM